jgi:hypothetical protein
MQIVKATSCLLLLSLFVCNAQALEAQYEIYPKWYMLTCAGFSYRLVLDNSTGRFVLQYQDECQGVTNSFTKGIFKLTKNKLVLNFGEFRAHYYIKEPYSPICDNHTDNLTDSEQSLVCDQSLLETADEYLPTDIMPKKVFIKSPALFLSKIEGTIKTKTTEVVVKDLKTHLFALDDRN